jgi:hypothetical protein
MRGPLRRRTPYDGPSLNTGHKAAAREKGAVYLHARISFLLRGGLDASRGEPHRS